MRAGCYDIDARVKDMDINGVWASVNFPSQITGFCGRVFSQCSDPELGLAVTQAWNDWFAEEWHAPHPERIVPMGITYLGDPEQGADEIRRNAERGFVAVTLPEQPHRVDMPNLFQGWWDPIIAACAETGTAICLHVGSTGVADMPPGSPMVPLGATLFGQLSLSACAEWLWSGYGDYFSGDLRPAEVLHRNFWFCTIDDPSTICTLDTVGVDHVMFETDYPHGDGTWPDSQAVFEKFYGGLSADEIAMISHENAATLFRHPLPPPGNPHAAGLRR
jgi:predicted TIM-barrel fold metal-dependent hydrolase